MTSESPKLFISYSWTSPSHEGWVLSLATELRDNGVDVVLDKWELKEGHDAYAFMEKMVTDPGIKKVAIICDHLYTEKADGRSGGVGTETQIISPEIYRGQEQTKFVAVLPERSEDAKPFLPAYYKSRIFIDLSSPDLYRTNFEQLLRWIYDKPQYIKPALGQMPAFLNDGASITLPTRVYFQRALNAIRDGRPNCQGALVEYFNAFSEGCERLRIPKDNEEIDEKVIRSIDEFLPFRNETIEIFVALSRYRDTSESWLALHKFFENLIPYLDRPLDVRSWSESDFDNFRFIVHELFLYAIAAQIRAECFKGIAILAREYYYVALNVELGRKAMVSFNYLYQAMPTLDKRNERLRLQRISLRADLLEKRSQSSGISFQQIMQADFILFIRDCLEYLRTGSWQRWLPVTLLYAERQYGPFELFARCQSAMYFENMKHIFDIEKKEELAPLAEAFGGQKLSIPRWGFHSFNPLELMGINEIGTLP